jgi:adenylate cyclase, class 2
MSKPPAAHLEIEVKFHLRGLESVRAALHAQGARLEHSRTFEENLRFDTPDGSLAQRGEILRLRRSADVRLTFKSPPRPAQDLLGRPEIEVVVEDFDAARQLLEHLGFEIVLRYEKHREAYGLGAVAVALDELPFGSFVELEGPSSEALQNAAAQLGLPWPAAFQGSYTSIFTWLREHRGLTARNLTFAEFADFEPADLGLPQSAVETANR